MHLSLAELKIAVLDEIDTIISEPFVNREEVQEHIHRLFEAAETPDEEAVEQTS